MKPLFYRASVAALPLLLALPAAGRAQVPQGPSAAEAQAALNNQAPAPIHYTRAQLDQMLAPIALYPDQLLTQLLMASTFPDQLVDAEKWLRDSNNAALKGDDLANALQPLPWDPSVKSLVAFPQLITMLTTHFDWTQALGTAFANQEVEVFARVQFLRERAMHAGNLKSTSQIAVRQEQSDIIIEPAEPDTIYVPVYNPAEVYGEWPDRDAPPVYIPPPPRLYSGPVGAGIAFSAGLAVAAPLWGWGHPDWHRHQIDIDRNRYENITNQNYNQQNRITIEGGAWHRGGPVPFVPEAQRPRPVQVQQQELPPGTMRPNEVPHPQGPGAGAPGGPRPAGEGQQPGQPQYRGEGPQGPRPAGQQQGQPQEQHHEAQPGPRPAGEGQQPGQPQNRGEGSQGPHPAGQQQGLPQEQHHEAQPGPRPAGEGQQPGQPQNRGEGPQGPHPAGQQQGQPQEQHHEAQPGPHPAEPNHPPPGPGPAPQERGAPQHPPEEHAAPQQHPPGPPPGAPPQPQPHPQAPPPQPQPHPQGPPPQQAHPQGPPPQQGHPGGPPPGGHPEGEKKPPPKPGEEQQQQR